LNSPLGSIKINIYFIALLLVISLNFLLLGFPITRTLGYEFSAVNGIILFIVSGVMFIGRIRNDSGQKSFIKSVSGFRYFVLLLISIPFLIGLSATLALTKCPFTVGIFFYFLIPIPSLLLGLISAYFSVFVSGKYSYLIFLILLIAFFLTPVFEFFIYPQVYFYNPVIGFFPGTVYDENLSIDIKLVLYRALNICFMALVIFSIDFAGRKRSFPKWVVVAIIAIGSVTLVIIKPWLHFATSTSYLETVLDNKIRTVHFSINYSGKAFPEERKTYTGLLHEYYFETIENQLKEHYTDKISTYLFASGESKMKLIGAGNANLAKPWLNQAYLNISSYEETLKHELVHVMASSFGATPLKVASNLNSAVIEGLAMAIENNFDGFPVDYLARTAYQSGYRIPIEKLFSGVNFFAQSSSLSYIYAGSFIKFLIDRYGIEKIKHLYGDVDFVKWLGKPISGLASDYISFIEGDRIEVNRYRAQLYFSGLTIFQKFCPRIVAERQKKADELLKAGKRDDAGALYKAVYSYSNSFHSLNGYLTCLSKGGRRGEAIGYLNTEIVKFKSSPYYFYLELLQGDLLAESGRGKEAKIIYDTLLLQNPHIEYRDGVLLREAIFHDEGTDSLISFFRKPSVLKLRKLLALNENELKYFSIPLMIELAEENNSDLDGFFLARKKFTRCADFESEFALVKISKYFLKKNELKEAQFFAVEAAKGMPDENSGHQAMENLKLVNWFINSVEDTGKRNRY
jgi:hypothetical protein